MFTHRTNRTQIDVGGFRYVVSTDIHHAELGEQFGGRSNDSLTTPFTLATHGESYPLPIA